MDALPRSADPPEAAIDDASSRTTDLVNGLGTPGTLHPRVDLERWLREFPVAMVKRRPAPVKFANPNAFASRIAAANAAIAAKAALKASATATVARPSVPIATPVMPPPTKVTNRPASLNAPATPPSPATAPVSATPPTPPATPPNQLPQFPESPDLMDETVDRWRARGDVISSPEHLALIEQVRRLVQRRHDLGPATPTDLVLFAVGEPPVPWLTKIGGIPWRPADRPWPTSDTGLPMTFVAQFCFVDSMDVMAFEPPDEIMLVFFQHHTAYRDAGSRQAIRVEWVGRDIPNPATAADCPWPTFQIPRLHAHLHRMMEYPRGFRHFQAEGYLDYWMFARTQATRMGTVSNFINEDPRRTQKIPRDAELLCTLNSFTPATFPTMSRYPLVAAEPNERSVSEIESLAFQLGDSGCLFFYIDEHANVHWFFDSY